jgi:hypothetical protein
LGACNGFLLIVNFSGYHRSEAHMFKQLFIYLSLFVAAVAHAENEWQFNLPIDRIVTTTSHSFLLINDSGLYPTCKRGSGTAYGWGGQGPFGVIQIPNKDMLAQLLTAKSMGQSLRFAVVSLNAGTFEAPGMGSTTCQMRYAELQ